jgi:hypothetical protein
MGGSPSLRIEPAQYNQSPLLYRWVLVELYHCGGGGLSDVGLSGILQDFDLEFESARKER